MTLKDIEERVRVILVPAEEASLKPRAPEVAVETFHMLRDLLAEIERDRLCGEAK